MAEVNKSIERAGGRSVLFCQSAWSSEQWMALGGVEYPDVEAVQKHPELLMAIDHYRYVEATSVLGTKWEPS